MDAKLSHDEMMAALYTIHIDNVAAWENEDITASQAIEREKDIDESYDDLVRQYEQGQAVLQKHIFVATHKFSASKDCEEYQQLISFLPGDCVGFVKMIYPSSQQARLIFFFPRPDPYETRRTMLYHWIISMDNERDMLVLSWPEGTISLQKIDEKHYVLMDGREGSDLSFIGFSVQVWAVMYALEIQLQRQFQITPTLAQKLGFSPEE